MESSTQSKYLFCYYFRLMNFIPRVVPIGGMGKQVPSPTSQKYDHHPHQEKFPLPADFPSHQIFLPSHQITIFMLEPNKNFNFSCSHCSCTIFIFLRIDHANFDFNRCSIFTERCFQLRKGRIIKITPPQIPTTSQKISPQQNFSFPHWGDFHLTP